jgi:hypothetical protein
VTYVPRVEAPKTEVKKLSGSSQLFGNPADLSFGSKDLTWEMRARMRRNGLPEVARK